MTRGISTSNLTELQKDGVVLAVFVELDLYDVLGAAQEYVRFCSGRNTLQVDGNDFAAVGGFLSIGTVSENTDMAAEKFVIELSGADSTNLSIIKDYRYQNRPSAMWLGTLDADTGLLVDDPHKVQVGKIDNMILNVGVERSSITVHIEDHMLRAYRPLNRKYTAQDQVVEFPLDKGLEFINSLVDKQINWGQKDAPPSSVSGSHSKGGPYLHQR